jgi:hypothetical protein
MRGHATSLSPFDGRCYGGSDSACALRPCAGGYLCRHCRLGLFAKLLEFSACQGKSHTQIKPLPALQGAPRGRVDPGRTSRRRDAQYVSLRRNRKALSWIDHGHRQRPQHPTTRENAGRQSAQARQASYKKQIGDSVESIFTSTLNWKVRLFLWKSRNGSRCSVNTRSENAVAEWRKQIMVEPIYGQLLLA